MEPSANARSRYIGGPNRTINYISGWPWSGPGLNLNNPPNRPDRKYSHTRYDSAKIPYETSCFDRRAGFRHSFHPWVPYDLNLYYNTGDDPRDPLTSCVIPHWRYPHFQTRYELKNSTQSTLDPRGYLSGNPNFFKPRTVFASAVISTATTSDASDSRGSRPSDLLSAPSSVDHTHRILLSQRSAPTLRTFLHCLSCPIPTNPVNNASRKRPAEDSELGLIVSTAGDPPNADVVEIVRHQVSALDRDFVIVNAGADVQAPQLDYQSGLESALENVRMLRLFYIMTSVAGAVSNFGVKFSNHIAGLVYRRQWDVVERRRVDERTGHPVTKRIKVSRDEDSSNDGYDDESPDVPAKEPAPPKGADSPTSVSTLAIPGSFPELASTSNADTAEEQNTEVHSQTDDSPLRKTWARKAFEDIVKEMSGLKRKPKILPGAPGRHLPRKNPLSSILRVNNSPRIVKRLQKSRALKTVRFTDSSVQHTPSPSHPLYIETDTLSRAIPGTDHDIFPGVTNDENAYKLSFSQSQPHPQEDWQNQGHPIASLHKHGNAHLIRARLERRRVEEQRLFGKEALAIQQLERQQLRQSRVNEPARITGDALEVKDNDEEDLLKRHPNITRRFNETLDMLKSKGHFAHNQPLVRPASPPSEPLLRLHISDDKEEELDDLGATIQLKIDAKEAHRRAEEAEKARLVEEEKLRLTGGLRTPRRLMVAPLTPDWTQKATATLHAPANQILAKTTEAELRRHDFLRLVPETEWLNDEIVNGSLLWLDRYVNAAAGITDVRSAGRKCLALSSFFYKRMQDHGVDKTERALRRMGVTKANFLSINTILLPICENNHWTLLVLRPNKRTISHMDSLNPAGSPHHVRRAREWVKAILKDDFKEDGWETVRHAAPPQTNGYDCGVHTITNGMCLALGLNPIDTYTSHEMPLQRLRIAAMLLNGGFTEDFDLATL